MEAKIDPELTQRLDVNEGAHSISNFLTVMAEELKILFDRIPTDVYMPIISRAAKASEQSVLSSII